MKIIIIYVFIVCSGLVLSVNTLMAEYKAPSADDFTLGCSLHPQSPTSLVYQGNCPREVWINCTLTDKRPQTDLESGKFEYFNYIWTFNNSGFDSYTPYYRQTGELRSVGIKSKEIGAPGVKKIQEDWIGVKLENIIFGKDVKNGKVIPVNRMSDKVVLRTKCISSRP